MKKFVKVCLQVLLALPSFYYSQAQDKIVLLNGKEINAISVDVKGDNLYYKCADDKKQKLRKMDKYKVFSILHVDGSEKIIYDPDTVVSGDPNVEQVRRYIKGEQYAEKVYKKNSNYIGGFISGLGGSFLSFYGLAVPAIYSTVVGSISPKHIPSSPDIDPSLFNSEEFKDGYQRKARNKKIRQSFLSGLAGIAIGLTALTIYEHNK